MSIKTFDLVGTIHGREYTEWGEYVSAVDYRELKAENESLRADAERYRWLRAQHWNSSVMSVVFDPKHSVKLGADCPSDLRLDVAIDFARNNSPENPS